METVIQSHAARRENRRSEPSQVRRTTTTACAAPDPCAKPATAEDNPLGVVAAAYAIRNRERVMNVVRSYPALAAILREVPAAVHAAFGSHCPLVLDARCFGVSPTDDELEVSIETPPGVVDALARLHDFDEAWWLDRVPEASGKLVITIEYV